MKTGIDMRVKERRRDYGVYYIGNNRTTIKLY